MSDNLDEVLNRKQTPEERKAEQVRWTRESVLSEAVRIVTAPGYTGTVGPNSVIAAAESFAAFVLGEK